MKYRLLKIGDPVLHQSERTEMRIAAIEGEFSLCQTIAKVKWPRPKSFLTSELKYSNPSPAGMIF
jgi:hypothetical protein